MASLVALLNERQVTDDSKIKFASVFYTNLIDNNIHSLINTIRLAHL